RPSGETVVVATLPARTGTAALRDLNGLAVGSDGAVYYTENAALRRIDSGGRVSTVAQNISPARCAPVQGIERRDQPLLRGLAVDAAGTVYVAATGCGSVLKVTAAGEVTTLFQSEGEWSPTGVALFGTDIYVLEFLGAGSDDRRAMVPRVREIAANGKTRVVATARRQ
ncbi:MAG TPA: SMP-30/gluconolactonase/LRE family protein, partial [Gemmatimonadaceae bacterium]|nr:SMP-30/gluconolactonase/LRE family protein [Gemmatimonadaceae bacterium]